MNRCVECKRFNLRADPKMAAHGFGGCERAPKGEYRSALFAHDCAAFAKADADKIASRKAWLDEKGRATT